MWDNDLRNKRVFYSRMWKIMRGFAPDEQVSGEQDDWLARVHPDDRERILTILRKQDSGDLARNAFEYRERHRDGHYIWILSRGRPIDWFPDGSVARTVGTDTDITSLKAVEEALAEEKERLRVTLESIGDGVISTDAEAMITFINPTAEQMTGWPLEEAIGKPADEVFTIIGETTGRLATGPVAECLAQERVYHPDEDVVLLSRSGERRDVRASAAPVRTPQGAIIGGVLVFQDITQSRTLQHELAFEHVTFAYEDAPVLSDVSFSVRKGEVVALVGPSGAGKSTLVDLIPRFHEPTAGRITLDGVDTKDIALQSLRALTGIVSQDTVLFNDTVRQNIAYAAAGKFSSAEIEAAARAANAHDFIMALPNGYDTVLGERGTRFRVASGSGSPSPVRSSSTPDSQPRWATRAGHVVGATGTGAIERLLTGRT